MPRFIYPTMLTLATTAALLTTAHAQQANNSAGPGQTGAIGANSEGPTQSGAAGASAGPNQTGAATPPQINPTPIPGGQPAGRAQAGNPSSPAPGQVSPQAGQGPSPFQNAPGRTQLGNNSLGSQQPAFVQQFGAIRQTPWFGNPAIRQQLRLQEQQFEQLNRGYADAWTNYNEGLLQLQQEQNRSERLRRQNALRGNFQQQFGRNLDSTLTDPTLRNRYQQLQLQYQGYGAFDDVVVGQRLRLTPNQRQQFVQLNQEWNEQMIALNQTYRTDRASALRRYAQLRDQMTGGINSVLTADQRRQWAQLIGTPYNFEGDAYFDTVNPNANNPIGNNQSPNTPPTSNQPIPPNAGTLR